MDRFLASVEKRAFRIAQIATSHSDDAFDIVQDAMNRLSELEDETLQAVFQIHDDLGFYIPDRELEDKTELIAREMCSVPFDFVTVPITVEVSIGRNWYNQKEIGVFKSTEFV